MANNVTVFVPKTEKTAVENLLKFIEYYKEHLSSLDGEVDFNSNVWDISKWVKKKCDDHRVNLFFSNWQTRKSRSGKLAMMEEPFLSFAKSYFVHQFLSGDKVKSYSKVATIRVLELALLEMTGSAHPSDISPVVLNHAAQILRNNFTSCGVAYACGKVLQSINELASSLRLLKVPSLWFNPLPRDGGYLNKVGEKFAQRRREKIPSPAAFNALGEIFQTGTDAEDILTSSVCALLCSSPSRIVEVTLLPSVCEVDDVDMEKGAVAYGIRWRPAKNGNPMVKYIPTPMHDIVREALKKIRDLSAPAREIVDWYEKNPTKLFLPAELEYLRGKRDLSMSEVGEIVFVDLNNARVTGAQWARQRSIPRFRKGKFEKELFADFADVEAAVLSMIPKNFPYVNDDNFLKYSEALMVLRKQELARRRATYRGMFQRVEPADIWFRVSPRLKYNLFKKYGFTESDGRSINLTTHKFRHYLNTIAEMNNMDQLDIARWSGRRNVSQNSYYFHTSGQEITEKIRLAFLGEVAAVGPISHFHKVDLIRRDEFALQRIPTAHTTDYGYCIHDFSMLPCQQHQDCMNCDEQICIKGQSYRQEKNIRAARRETEALLASANEALDEKVYGADKWVKHQKLTLDRLNSLCSILDDPNVPDKAVIRLVDSSTQGLIAQATERRAIEMTDEDQGE